MGNNSAGGFSSCYSNATKRAFIKAYEPFANIDEENRQLILKQLVRLNSDYHTTIIITDHDLHGQRSDYIHLVWQLAKGAPRPAFH